MTKIKDLPNIDRPREKLLKYGTDKLSTTELLAIILRSGIKGINVVELAKSIMKKFSAKDLQNISIKDLKGVKGLGNIKAIEILASIEFGKRILQDNTKIKVLSPQDIFNSFKYLQTSKKENFISLYLDTKNQEICREIISVGTLNASLVHPREVFEPAVRNLASSLILIHTHPSGNCEPSEEDILVTENLIKSGKIMGIEIFDHVIIGNPEYFSFKEKGLLFK